MSAERPVPSLEILIGAISEVDQRVTEYGETMVASTKMTDDVLGELSLQLAYLMQITKITETQNGGLAGPDGKVVSVTKSAAQVYIERGRAALIKQRERLQREQGLPTDAHSPTGEATGTVTHAGNGEAKDAEVELGPKRVTH